jgi:predicted lipoprotein with Yx(FWY)xxD motif
VCREHRRVEPAVGDQFHQLGDRLRVDQSRGDRDVAGPQLLEVKSGGVTVHADVRHPPARTDQLTRQLERIGHANRLERDVGAESVRELHDLCEGVLATVVDRRVGSELRAALQATVGEVDCDGSPGCVELGGPTGLALASDGTLYVASTEDNKILAISEATTRTTAAAKGGTVLTEGGHLNEPLGMVLAPNGNIITSNGGDGNMVETTPAGQQVAVQSADTKTGAGSLFGLVLAPGGKSIYFVDDGENTLNLLHEGPSATPTTSSTAAAPTATTTAPATKSVSLSVRTLPTVGAVLVNAEGHTLYTFAPDNRSKVTCVSSCATLWPPVKLPSGETPAGPVQLKASLLGSDPDPEGGSVVTYSGWPLYTYAADSAAGEDNGQAIEADGGLWYVIAPSGKVLTTH